jgi:hypothetical protein
MRKLIAKGFVLEFVSIIALIFSVALAWAGSLLELPTEVIISASIGIAVAAYIWALKWEINKELQDKLALYNLLETIKDEDLYERAKMAIEECRVELEDLSKGILRLDTGQLFNYLIKITGTANHHIRASHIGLDEKYLELWQTGGEQQWYQHNINMVNRGVLFERSFILSQSTAIDSASGKLKPKISALLQAQARDGIKVEVIWQEKLEDDPELIQDFAIVDSNVALVTQPSWSGRYSANVYRRKFEVERYIEIFEALRARGLSLLDLNDSLSNQHHVHEES